jgi:hypothetical protein
VPRYAGRPALTIVDSLHIASFADGLFGRNVLRRLIHAENWCLQLLVEARA